MKYNSAIYILPFHPIFNIDEAPVFEGFDKPSSLNLYSALILNYEELLKQFEPRTNIIYCFDEKDKDFLPDSFNLNSNIIYYNDLSRKKELLELLADKYFHSCTNNLILFADSIGTVPKDIEKVFNLLSIEDESVVVGKSSNGNLAFIGFNTFSSELFDGSFLQETSFDKFLPNVSKHESFLHVLGDYMTIKSLNDFKILYHELSKKESLAYCSHHIHELFTNLFIEYKEHLK